MTAAGKSPPISNTPLAVPDSAGIVAAVGVPVPFSPLLENAYRPDVPRIVEAAWAVMQF